MSKMSARARARAEKKKMCRDHKGYREEHKQLIRVHLFGAKGALVANRKADYNNHMRIVKQTKKELSAIRNFLKLQGC